MKDESFISDQVMRVVEDLRDELHQYGEMLALLDQQQEAVMVRAADEVMKSVVAIHEQRAAVQVSRKRRGSDQAALARALGRSEDAPLSVLIPLVPGGRGVVVEALLSENNALVGKVRRRAQQNHLLLGRSVVLMREFLNALGPAPQPRADDEGVGSLRGDDPCAVYTH